MEEEIKLCPCGSLSSYDECCKPYFELLKISTIHTSEDSLLVNWLSSHAQVSPLKYLNKVNKFLYRISSYLDNIFDLYYHLKFTKNQNDKDDSIYALKINILNSILASLTCLSQGLLLQSGILLRSVIEDSLILIDISENKDQLLRFTENKYKTNNLLSRIKRNIPECIVNWYGYFSSKFTHSGPLRNIDILPMACHPDDRAVIAGLQNLTRACVCLNICLEKIYFNLVKDHYFWYRNKRGTLVFNEDSPVFEWAYELGQELNKEFPGQIKEGFIRSEKSLKL